MDARLPPECGVPAHAGDVSGWPLAAGVLSGSFSSVRFQGLVRQVMRKSRLEKAIPHETSFARPRLPAPSVVPAQAVVPAQWRSGAVAQWRNYTRFAGWLHRLRNRRQSAGGGGFGGFGGVATARVMRGRAGRLLRVMRGRAGQLLRMMRGRAGRLLRVMRERAGRLLRGGRRTKSRLSASFCTPFVRCDSLSVHGVSLFLHGESGVGACWGVAMCL